MAHSGAASGGELEEKLDLSSEVESKLQQAQTLVDANALKEALSLLAAAEKKCRVGNDTPSLIKVCEASLQFAKNDFELLLVALETLSTRRSQKSAAIKSMVQLALPWVVDEATPTTPHENDFQGEQRDALVVALRNITDGKLYLEAERARLTRLLATIKEAAGDIDAAASILQEVHVETYGSISKKEKVEFILEQMRLTLLKKDFIRAHIVSNKIQRKLLAQEDMAEYKVTFFTLMAEYHMHDQDALELAKDYHAIYSTPGDYHSALDKAVMFLALAPYSNEQQDLMNKLFQDENVKGPSHDALRLFLKQEIIPSGMAPHLDIPTEDWQEVFQRRVLQHNIRVVAKYYKRIRGERLAQLLNLSKDVLELELSKMVSQGDLYAKMDRPADIIRFTSVKSPESILSEWATDIDTLLNLVEKTTHLIQKETMTT